MPAKPLIVPAGTTLELDLSRPDTVVDRLAFRRPLTPAAVKAITGAAAPQAVRLDDVKAFEPIEDQQRLKELVRFQPDEHGQVNKMDPSLLRAVLLALPDNGPIPQTVRLEQRARTLDQWRSAARLRVQRVDPLRTDIGRVVRVAQVAVPPWLRDFQFFFPLLLFTDLVVEANATLIIASNVIAFMAQSITMRQGARILQHSAHLTVTVSGKIEGIAA